jgi:Icc-related predicted phosphoesterase
LDAIYQIDALRELDQFTESLGYKHVLLIAGNHDWVFECRKGDDLRLRNMTYLEDSGVELDGLKFYGSPHQPEFYSWAFNLPRNGEALRRYWSLIPDDTDVLITHGPPWGILDQPRRGDQHAGCELLARRVSEVRPRVHIFGHIHGGYGRVQVGPTLFVNACLCDEEYRPVNDPQVIEIGVTTDKTTV